MSKLVVFGTVEGVDFVKSGVIFDENTGQKMPYGSSVSLILSQFVDIEKAGIKTKTKRSFRVQIPVADDILEYEVNKYNAYIGKNIEAPFIPTEGQRFKLHGELNVPKS